MLVGRPSVPEQRQRDKERAGDHRRKAEFRLGGAVLLGKILEQPVRDRTHDEQADDGANADSQICQPHAPLRKAVLVLEDRRHGGEEEVEIAVDDGHVERQEEHDRGPKQHLGRAHNGKEKEVLCRAPAVEGRPEVRVARFLAQSLGLAIEDGIGV